MREFARQICEAVRTGRLSEPFSSSHVKTTCPGWADQTYRTFLAKHAEGNGQTTELFTRVSRGRYILKL